MADTGDLLPCPFCDHPTPVVASAPYGVGTAYRVYCPGCECRGPRARSGAEARARWDGRLVPYAPREGCPCCGRAY